MIKAVAKFFGTETDAYGMPSPFFSYLVVSSPWSKPDSGIASIVPLSGSVSSSETIADAIVLNHLVLSGGEQAAYQKAISALKNAGAHTGLSFHEHVA